VQLALAPFDDAIGELSDPIDVVYRRHAVNIPADLHRLEGLAARAVRHSQGSPTAVKALSTARRRHEELMLQAADSPGVTSGSACILDAGART
jgi:hypothetical protein